MPAEIAPQMLILKHVLNWSYDFGSGRCGPMYLWEDLAASSLVPLFPSH